VQVPCVLIFTTFSYTKRQMHLQQERGHQIDAPLPGYTSDSSAGALCKACVVKSTTLWQQTAVALTAGTRTPDRRAAPGSCMTAGAGGV
jgi:hypothetical protein